MYLIYGNKTAKVPILTDGGSPIEVIEEPSESEGTFDEFDVDTAHLNDEEQKAAFHLLYQEKDLFARNMNDLGQTSAVIHEIDTKSAALIK
ncbi:26683_t:CDS:2 [Gigaspora margarita]|uniref:26683_t:CDS:1 n=1 Tax=Gigaspora margarita TaxID=4874 RepID=A0ABN7UJD4_GIGMA|nr:26683_t:CDS:2 [Gigaspora margarita]